MKLLTTMTTDVISSHGLRLDVCIVMEPRGEYNWHVEYMFAVEDEVTESGHAVLYESTTTFAIAALDEAAKDILELWVRTRVAMYWGIDTSQVALNNTRWRQTIP